MVYQLKLIDQNLPGLTREMAQGCWQAVEVLTNERPSMMLYRRIYRALRAHIAAMAAAYRYCGAKGCEEGPAVFGMREWTEPLPPERERLHRYLLKTEQNPEQVVNALVSGVIRTVAAAYPGQHWRGLSRLLHGRVTRVLHGRLYAAPRCGHQPLCSVNEPADPWDLGDPINAT